MIGCSADPGQLQPILDRCNRQSKGDKSLPGGEIVAPNGGLFCSLGVNEVLPGYSYVVNPDPNTFLGYCSQLMAGTMTPLDAATPVFNNAPFWLKIIAGPIVWASAWPVVFAGSVLRGWLDGEACTNIAVIPLMAWRVIVGFAERWISPVFGDMAITATYLSNWMCPRGIPSTAEAQAAYLANAIDEPLRDTWTSANGDCPEPAFAVLQARRAKEDVSTLIQLWRRQIIDNDTFNERLRELGYIRDYEGSDFQQLSNQIPPVSELIRMMVRDVADQNLVTKFGMDADFGNKWTGQLQQWGNQQGISDQYAQFEWRAHWGIPSPGQLYEMYHRFRNLDPTDPLYTDLQTIQTALEQQDILPYWIPKLLGTSFRLVTRSDIIQMMYYGSLSDTEAAKKVSQLGYSDADSQLYVSYLKQRRKLRARTHPYTRSYISGNISVTKLQNQLQSDNYSQTDVQDCVDYATTLRKAKTTAKCRESARKRFMLGELNIADVPAVLIGYGYDAQEATDFAAAWQCERDARIKQVAATKLCGWYASGLITADDFASRLTNLAYQPADVINIITACQQGISKKQALAAAQKLKQQLALAQKIAKQQAQAAKQAARAAEQQAKQITAMQAAALARQKQMVRAAEKWSRGCGGNVADNMDEITSAVAWIRANTNLTYDEAIAAVIEAAQLMDGKASCDWTGVYQGVAAGWDEAAETSPGPLDIVAVEPIAGVQGPPAGGTPAVSPGPSPTTQ